jgi:hypothetical protein
MSWWLSLMLACGSPAQSEQPPPEPEPAPEAAKVRVEVGTQCVEPAADEPADEAAVKARLDAAGIAYTAIEAVAVCEACNTCPRMAFDVTTEATAEEAQAAVGPPAGPPPSTVKVAVGRKCQDPAEGAPTDVAGVLEALKAEGIEVLKHEEMVVCQSCGCPDIALMVEVGSADVIPTKELSQAWVPERKKNDLKGSLP